MSRKIGVEVMGILNVTPDSFSDGGNFVDVSRAVAHAQQMRGEGADIIDVGGESTRPGAEAVDLDEEWRRVEPVILRLTELGIPESLDTRKFELARRGLELGVDMINDVSGGDDPRMVAVIASAGARYCLMHHQGDSKTMQDSPSYIEVVSDVRSWLSDRVEQCVAAGIARERLLVDPGFGFGKTTQQNLDLLKNLREFRRIRVPILVGLSRKSFIGRFLGTEENPADVAQRLPATLIAQLEAVAAGAAVVRTHDVAATCSSLRMAQELNFLAE